MSSRQRKSLGFLAERLGMAPTELAAIRPEYRAFQIPKRHGRGYRRILAPAPRLKAAQRLLNRRALRLGVNAWRSVIGFERRRSAVFHARYHLRREVIVRLDIEDFFGSTRSERVRSFFTGPGRWSDEAARRLTELCTFEGSLPQGAPTSPTLSNLVNYELDRSLFYLASRAGAVHTRYADDLAFSWDRDDPAVVRRLIHVARFILAKFGYRLNRRKLRVLRRHQQQKVAGIVVNERVNLPRSTRRWLRAVEHRLETGRQATLTAVQVEGWRAYRRMIEAAKDLPPLC